MSPPSNATMPPEFSEPWMGPWVEVAGRTGSLEAACKEFEITLANIHRARLADPAFDRAIRDHDRVMDLKITESLREGAVKGDVRSQSLYFTRVRDLVFGDDDAGDEPTIPAAVAESMIRAGLLSLGELDDDAPPARPNPWSERRQTRIDRTPILGSDGD